MSHIMKCIYLLAVVILLAACQNEEPEQVGASTGTIVEPEEAFLGQTGELRYKINHGDTITYRRINGENVFEGDMILTDEQLEEMVESDGTATESIYDSRSSRRWPNGVVPYVITNSSLTARALNAMAHIEANSTVNFVPRNGHSNYIRFVVSTGCSSSVGMVGGAQNINLGPGCSTGNTIHELMHALGFHHEQTRSDRNTYVTIYENNIENGKKGNFERKTNRVNLFGRFDLESIMMYGSYAFSKNGLPTITRKDGSTFSAQRNGLTLRDQWALNHVYPSLWTKLSGKATDIGIGANGHTYITGASWVGSGGYDVFRRSGNSWVKVGGQGVKVAVSPAGTPWLINAKGEIFRRTGSHWQKMPGKATDIGIGANGQVYITGYTHPSSGGGAIYRWNGSGWTAIGGYAIRIAVQSNGKPIVVNKKGEIFRRGSGNWIKMSGKATDIAVGGDGSIFITGYTKENDNYGVFKRILGRWERISGGATRIAVATNGLPWVVNKDKNIYRLKRLDP